MKPLLETSMIGSLFQIDDCSILQGVRHGLWTPRILFLAFEHTNWALDFLAIPDRTLRWYSEQKSSVCIVWPIP